MKREHSRRLTSAPPKFIRLKPVYNPVDSSTINDIKVRKIIVCKLFISAERNTGQITKKKEFGQTTAFERNNNA